MEETLGKEAKTSTMEESKKSVLSGTDEKSKKKNAGSLLLDYD